MGLLGNFRLGRKASRMGLSIADLDKEMDQESSGYPSHTGIDVSGSTAMNYSAVFCAVQTIAQTVASLPLFVYRRIRDKSRKRLYDHPLTKLLHDQPNPEMTAFTFREILTSHALLWGNGYAQIIRNKMGEPTALWPINPEIMKVERNKESGKIVYKYRNGNDQEVELSSYQVFHIPGIGFDGRIGYSVISKARQSIGLGLATEEYGSRFFGSGGGQHIVLEMDGVFKKTDTSDNLRKQWDERYGGLKGKHRPIILEQGMKANTLTMPHDDAQFLETRKFQVVDIARWFNMPPHKLKELDRATFSNIEHQQIEFVQDCIRSWLIRWEQSGNWKLLEHERGLYMEHNIEGLLRGDIASRMQAYHQMRLDGIINADEWRALENMNPQKGEQGKIYWMPLNMTDASKGSEIEPITETPFTGEQEEKSIVNRMQNIGLGERSIRSVTSRRKVAGRYKELFRLATRQILEKEVKAIEKILKKSFTERTLEDFNSEIDQWYEKNSKTIRKSFAGVITAYAEDIKPIAMEEVNSEGIDQARYDEYKEGYIDRTSNRYVSSSRGQVKSLARNVTEEGGDPQEAIQKRLDEWNEKRPDKVSDREIIAGECAIAQFVYFESGFSTRWVTLGKSCPYCDSLNGMVIDRGGSFLSAGMAWEPEGANHGAMMISSNTRHPPAHGGCDCGIVAG